MSRKSNKVVIGLKFNRQNVEEVAIYDINKDKVIMLSTKEAKELYTDKKLSVINADFNFFVNKVNFYIGEQQNYPVIFENKDKSGKIQRNIENAVIIYDIDKTENGYNTLIIKNNKIKTFELDEKSLKDLYSGGYKCNYSIKNNKLKIIYKEDGIQKEYLEDDISYDLFNKFKSWYKLDNNGKMEKISDCDKSTFEINHNEKIIDGFTNSDIIEEVDLSGAIYIAPKAFYNCKNLKKVILSNSLQQIGSQAFANCPKLTELSIPKNCTKIGMKIFDNGTVYLENDISKQKGIITPFGPKTKIILNGKQSKIVDTIKVAYYEDNTTLYYYEIDLTGTKKEVYKENKIKKSDIDILEDIYINYQDNKVLYGNNTDEDFIVCGKVGKEFLVIMHSFGDWKNSSEISQCSYEFLYESGCNPTNGTYTKDDIIPLNPDWGWYQINNKSSVASKIGEQLTEINDTGKILKDNEKIIMADYINKKFETKYGKIVLGSAKATQKSKEEKDKYPDLTWIYGGQYPGGIACDNPGKLNPKTGKIEYQDADGNYYCYFGHKTFNHIMAKGIKNDKVIKTFTFGIKCASDFLEIDMSTLSKIKEFQGILIEALDEITDVIKNKSYKNYIEKHKNLYEILSYIKKANRFDLLGPYGNIIKRCIENNIIIPKALINDIQIKDPYNIYKLCITKEKDNLDLIYKFPTLKNINSENNEILDNIKSKLNENLVTYDKSLTEIKQIINSIKVDKTEYDKVLDIKNTFNKLGLQEGKYVLDEMFYVNTDKCEIIDFSKATRETISDPNYKVISNLKHPVALNMIEYFNTIDKTNIRPTGSYPLYESKYIKQAKLLNDILDIKNIPNNKVKLIISYSTYYKSIYKQNCVALAYKNTLYGWGTNNYNKPILLYKNGILNVDGEYGIIDNINNSNKIFTTFFTNNLNSNRAYYEIDFDTNKFKYSSINKVLETLGKEITDEASKNYIDLINGLDITKYNKTGFLSIFPEHLTKLLPELDYSKYFIVLLGVNNYKQFIYNDTKNIYIYPAVNDDNNYIPTTIDLNKPKKSDKVVDIDEEFYKPNLSLIYYLAKPIKQGDLSKINAIKQLDSKFYKFNRYEKTIFGIDNDNNIYTGDGYTLDKNLDKLLLDGGKFINNNIDFSDNIKTYDIKLLDKDNINNTLKNIKEFELEAAKKEKEELEKRLSAYNEIESKIADADNKYNELIKNNQAINILGKNKYIPSSDTINYHRSIEEILNDYKKFREKFDKIDKNNLSKEDYNIIISRADININYQIEGLIKLYKYFNDYITANPDAIKKVEEANQKLQRIKQIQQYVDELEKVKDKWQELNIDVLPINQFKQYKEKAFKTVLDNVEYQYNKYKNSIDSSNNLPTNKASKYSNEFIQALKDNIDNVDKWIQNATYINAYKQIGQNLISGKGIIGKQDQIVKHIKQDLEKYLDKSL